TREILTLAAVVVLGAIMTVLDATIVNVALPTLGREFGTSIATIQWVTTAYLLAFASVIPLTGWARQRLGAKELSLLSLVLFTTGSLLAGLSWSIGALIAFRVVQGFGGGMIMPLGQTILAQAAGPKRMGRVMSIVGVPLLLAPIIGPVIGGALVDAVSWRWIFFVNLPVSAVALLLAIKRLPRTPRHGQVHLDLLGAILLPGGIALFLWGLAEVGRHGTLTAAAPLTALLVGLALVAGFVLHALRSSNPLLDVRLFTRRGFATPAATNLTLGVALFGVALLLPLYFQLIRGPQPARDGAAADPARTRRRNLDQHRRRAHRQARRPAGRAGRPPPRPRRHARLHPDRRRQQLLVPRRRPVPDRRRPRRPDHTLDGSRLPKPRARRDPRPHQPHH